MSESVTTNYSFKKQDLGHPLRDTYIADNLDLIDTAIKARQNEIFADDIPLRLGSADAPATRITMEFDKTTTGVGSLKMGEYGYPMVLNANPGSVVIPAIMNVEHSAGAGDCGDLVALYVRAGVSGDGDSGLTIVPLAPRMDIDAECQEAYCLQAHSTHKTTDGLLAMATLSLKTTIEAGAFTATNSFVVGEVILNGDSPGAITSATRRRSVFALHAENTAPSIDSVLLLTDGAGKATALIDAYNIGTGLFLKIDGTPTVYNASFSGQGAAEPDASVKVNVEGHDLYLYAFPTPVS